MNRQHSRGGDEEECVSETTPSLSRSPSDSLSLSPQALHPLNIGRSRILHKKTYSETGFCIIGPHYLGVIFVHFFLWGATAFFVGVFKEKTFLRLLVYTLSVSTNYWLIQCSLSDPGIVNGPKVLPPSVLEDENLYRQYRYCDICEIFQGPRTSHCSSCGVCIEGLDHHCPWMSKCVGDKNMRAFKYFNVCWVIELTICFVGVFMFAGE